MQTAQEVIMSPSRERCAKDTRASSRVSWFLHVLFYLTFFWPFSFIFAMLFSLHYLFNYVLLNAHCLIPVLLAIEIFIISMYFFFFFCQFNACLIMLMYSLYIFNNMHLCVAFMCIFDSFAF